MKLPPIGRQQVAGALLALAALMAVDCLYQLGMHVRWQWWMPSSLVTAAVASQPSASQATDTRQVPASATSSASSSATAPSAEGTAGGPSSCPAATSPAGPVATRAAAVQPVAQADAAQRRPDRPGRGSEAAAPYRLAESLKRRNIMAEPKPTGHGLSLAGLLGSAAVFRTREGQLVSVEEGQSGAGGIKLVRIDGAAAVIEFEGKTETLSIVASGPAEGPRGEPPRPSRPGEPGPRGPASGGGAAPAAAPASSASGGTSQPAGLPAAQASK